VSDSTSNNLEFRATGGECAAFLITRALLTICTFGIYGFWAASAWKKWVASKTYVHGEPLVYTTSFADFVLSQIVKLACIVFTLGLYLPWAVVKGNRYDWRHTTVADGRTCRFDGGGAGFVGTSILAAIMGLCTCGLGSPWAFAMVVKWGWSHTLIGGERVQFHGSVGDLLLRAIGGQILCVFTLGLFIPWHIVNLQRWRIANATVAKGSDSTPTPPDPIERVIEARARDPKTWIGLGVVGALILAIVLGLGAVRGIAGWVASSGQPDGVPFGGAVVTLDDDLDAQVTRLQADGFECSPGFDYLGVMDFASCELFPDDPDASFRILLDENYDLDQIRLESMSDSTVRGAVEAIESALGPALSTRTKRESQCDVKVSTFELNGTRFDLYDPEGCGSESMMYIKLAN